MLPEKRAVGEADILHVGAAGVRRLHETEEPGTVAPACGEKRLERVAAEIRAHGDSVGERGIVAARFDVRGRVRPRGGADVAALDVGDDEQLGRVRVGADLLEGPHPVRAERLEERRLRLHRHGVRRDGVDDPPAEPRTRGGGVLAAEDGLAAQLDRKLVRHRVEPDDDLAPLALDRVGDSVGEMRHGHRRHTPECTERLGTREGPLPRPLDDPRRRRARAALAPLDGRFEGAAGRELRDACCGDVHFLGRIARIHAGARSPLLARELAETGEGHITAALQRIGDRLQESVDCLARVARCQLAPPRDLVHKLLFGHVPLLLSLIGSRAVMTLPGVPDSLNHAV